MNFRPFTPGDLLVAAPFEVDATVSAFDQAAGFVDAAGLTLLITVMLLIALYAWATLSVTRISLAGIRKGEPQSVAFGLVLILIVITLIGIVL